MTAEELLEACEKDMEANNFSEDRKIVVRANGKLLEAMRVICDPSEPFFDRVESMRDMTNGLTLISRTPETIIALMANQYRAEAKCWEHLRKRFPS